MNSNFPTFLYGTAWKKDRTADCVMQALENGMVGIDTANQRKHYNEPGVGEGLKLAYAGGIVRRKDVFLQSKFTFAEFQDRDGYLPFCETDSPGDQLRASFEDSLTNLDTDYLDSFLVHAPSTQGLLTDKDRLIWRQMECLVEEKRIRNIGVSNFSATQITELYQFAEIKPVFAQNRCYPTITWDRSARSVCLDLGIYYQGFNLQRDPLLHEYPYWLKLSSKYDLPITTLVYSFARQAKIMPLTGATKLSHLEENLRASADIFTPEEMKLIESASFLDDF